MLGGNISTYLEIYPKRMSRESWRMSTSAFRELCFICTMRTQMEEKTPNVCQLADNTAMFSHMCLHIGLGDTQLNVYSAKSYMNHLQMCSTIFHV